MMLMALTTQNYFNGAWTIDNTLSLITIIITMIGGAFALYQWSVANRLKSSEFLAGINEKILTDNDMAEVFYLIEYSEGWYDEEFHQPDNKWQYKVDRLLMYLNYICYLRAKRIISNDEFLVVKYEVERVCLSPDVQSYLWNLYHFANVQGTIISFKFLIEYAIKNKLFYSDFKNVKSKNYIKQLNF